MFVDPSYFMSFVFVKDAIVVIINPSELDL